jgi:phage shock protein E
MAVQRLSAAEFRERREQEPGAVLDVRTPGEYNTGHLQGATNYDFLSGEFSRKVNDFDKDRTYYLYCASGNRSGTAAQMMQNAGFERVYNIGGFTDLKAGGLPTE